MYFGLHGVVGERLLMDSEKVFDVLSAWQIEYASRKDAKDISSYSLMLKITLMTGMNEKYVNTCTLHYIQVHICLRLFADSSIITL